MSIHLSHALSSGEEAQLSSLRSEILNPYMARAFWISMYSGPRSLDVPAFRTERHADSGRESRSRSAAVVFRSSSRGPALLDGEASLVAGERARAGGYPGASVCGTFEEGGRLSWADVPTGQVIRGLVDPSDNRPLVKVVTRNLLWRSQSSSSIPASL